MAALDLVEKIRGAWSQGKAAIGVFLDLKKAFDTVDHAKLLDVLHHRFGFRGLVLEWIESYLRSRSFRVNIRGELSSIIHLICGVPQGSLLGPILFLLYVGEIQDLVCGTIWAEDQALCG